MKKSRLKENSSLSYLLLLIGKIGMICYLVLFSTSYLSVNTTAYFTDENNLNGVVYTGNWDNQENEEEASVEKQLEVEPVREYGIAYEEKPDKPAEEEISEDNKINNESINKEDSDEVVTKDELVINSEEIRENQLTNKDALKKEEHEGEGSDGGKSKTEEKGD